MERTKNSTVRFLIYVVLAVFMLYSILPFGWTILNSVKLPKDATGSIPKIPGQFEATSQNYVSLWLNVSEADAASVGFVLLLLLVLLALLGLFAGRLPWPNSYTYTGIVLGVVGIVLVLPSMVDTAEFYDYLINSVIVTIGTLAVSLSIGSLAGYGLARYRHLISVFILVLALAFRALPNISFVLPFFYLGQISGLYDTHILLICLPGGHESALHHLDAAQLLHGDLAGDRRGGDDRRRRPLAGFLARHRADRLAGHHHHRPIHAAAGLQ